MVTLSNWTWWLRYCRVLLSIRFISCTNQGLSICTLHKDFWDFCCTLNIHSPPYNVKSHSLITVSGSVVTALEFHTIHLCPVACSNYEKKKCSLFHGYVSLTVLVNGPHSHKVVTPPFFSLIFHKNTVSNDSINENYKV